MPALFDRSLSLSGASNFRDLGGYQGEGGRHVRWRKLFRSDHLAALTPDDLAAFGALGVTRAFDLRGAAERAAVSATALTRSTRDCQATATSAGGGASARAGAWAEMAHSAGPSSRAGARRGRSMEIGVMEFPRKRGRSIPDSSLARRQGRR